MRKISMLFIVMMLLLTACENIGQQNPKPQEIDADFDNYVSILFFDSTLEELATDLADVDTDWAKAYQDAYAQVQAGENDAAIATLRTLADDSSLEIGLRLWAWNGLRELGVEAEDKAVYGYFIQVPVESNGETWFDSLAVYNDGRLRYINGKLGIPGMFVWENYDTNHPLNQEAIATIELAQATLSVGSPIPAHLKTIPTEPRITLLTFDGLYVIDFNEETYTSDVEAFWEAVTNLFVSAVATSQEN